MDHALDLVDKGLFCQTLVRVLINFFRADRKNFVRKQFPTKMCKLISTKRNWKKAAKKKKTTEWGNKEKKTASNGVCPTVPRDSLIQDVDGNVRW